MKKQPKNLLKEKIKEEKITLSSLEEILDLLSEKVKKLAKKNGFSKNLKEKIEYDLK